MALFAEIGCMIFVIISAILEIRKLVKLKKKYFKQVGWIDVTNSQNNTNTMNTYWHCHHNTMWSLHVHNCFIFQIWNIMQLLAITMFLIAMGFYINRSLWTTTLVEEVMNNRGIYMQNWYVFYSNIIKQVSVICIHLFTSDRTFSFR